MKSKETSEEVHRRLQAELDEEGPKNLGLSQTDLQEMFRGRELASRNTRRIQLREQLANIVARMKNEGMLLEEELTSEGKEAHAKAIQQMRDQDAAFQKELYGYWRRLWRALLNR